MKEKLLQALKNKYANLGLGDKILSGFASKLAKTITEESQIETAVDGVEDDLQLWQSITDQHRTEISALKKQITVKKEEKKTEDDPVPKDEDKDDEKIPAWAKTVLSELSVLKGEKTLTTREAALRETLKGAPESVINDKLNSLKYMKGISEDEFNAFVEETKTGLPELVKMAAPKQTSKPQLSAINTDVPQTRVTEAIQKHAQKINPAKTN